MACLLFIALLWRSLPTANNTNRVRVHVRSLGTGRPAVVFESGIGEDVATWDHVQPEIATLTTTLAYDRPGLGRSLPNNHSRDGRQIAMDLHEMLERSRIPTPYVLVGHSLGGAIVLPLASMYPDEVAGLVLVDPEDGRLVEQLHARLPGRYLGDREKALTEAIRTCRRRRARNWRRQRPRASRWIVRSPFPRCRYRPDRHPEGPGISGNPLEQDLKLELHRQWSPGSGYRASAGPRVAALHPDRCA